MRALREVIERKGAFCAMYSDRASHFFYTPKAGQGVDRTHPTQVGRALAEMGIQTIAAYSPQARGRGERNFGTWQGRLPQELRIHGIRSMASANEFLREAYVQEFNQTLCGSCGATWTCFSASAREESGSDLFLAARAHREPGQHRAHWSVCSANRKVPLESHAGRVSGHGLPAPRWYLEHRLRPAHRGALQPARNRRARNASATQNSGEAGVATLPPPPQTQHHKPTPNT